MISPAVSRMCGEGVVVDMVGVAWVARTICSPKRRCGVPHARTAAAIRYRQRYTPVGQCGSAQWHITLFAPGHHHHTQSTALLQRARARLSSRPCGNPPSLCFHQHTLIGRRSSLDRLAMRRLPPPGCRSSARPTTAPSQYNTYVVCARPEESTERASEGEEGSKGGRIR